MRDDEGQMLLLTAVVLVTFFLVLTLVVLRGQQAAIAADAPDAFREPSDVAHDGLIALAHRLDSGGAFTKADFNDGWRTLVLLEAAQGFAMTGPQTPAGADAYFCPAGGPGVLSATYTLQDASTRVTQTVTVDVSACPT